MQVELITSSGDDNTICNAARVSTGNDDVGYKESQGLINYLWREGHTSPFEHVNFTFKLSVPIFIARQIMRHRVFSYNEISGRYSKLLTDYWLPSKDRPLHNKGSGAYPKLTFHEDHETKREDTINQMRKVYRVAQEAYEEMLQNGIATEVARAVLPVSVYTEFYMTGNLKNFFDFIDIRTKNNAQYEVAEVANELSEFFADHTPLAWKAFVNATV